MREVLRCRLPSRAREPRNTYRWAEPPSELPAVDKYVSYKSSEDWFVTARNEVGGKVMFSHVSVILFTGGSDTIACWDTPPPGPEAGTPDTRDRHPPRIRLPWEQIPPRHSAFWEMRTTSRWYASYWNAILLTENVYDVYYVVGRTLGHAYKEHPIISSRFLWIKIIDSNVKQFGYKEPLVKSSFFYIFLLAVSGIQSM